MRFPPLRSLALPVMCAVAFPIHAAAQQLVFDPPIDSGITASAPAGGSTTATVALTNAGATALEFAFPHFAHHRELGGPDEFGYSWIDSHQPHGPSFDPVDIRDTGIEATPLLASPGCKYPPADEGYQVLDLPFPFTFYGETHSEVWVSANGFLTFDPQVFQVQCSFSVHDIPSTSRPNDFIAPLWADLHGYSDGRIYSEHLADGRFVVQWTDWARFGQQGSLNTFQAILYPSGEIRLQYLQLDGSFGNATRIGIENQDGTIGLQVASGGGYAEPGLVVRLTEAPTFVTSVTPASGTLAPAQSVDVLVNVSAVGLLEGTYSGHLRVTTMGQGNEEVHDYPVNLTVAGEAGCAIEPPVVEFPSTVVGDAVADTVLVLNKGTAACAITGATVESEHFYVALDEPVTVEPGASTDVVVGFAPKSSGELQTMLTLTTDGEDLTAVLQGSGIDAPVPLLDTESLDITLPAESTATALVTLQNAAMPGAADLEYQLSLRLPRSRARIPSAAARPATVSSDGGLRDERTRVTGPFPQTVAPRAGSHGDELIQDGSFEAGTPNPYWSEGSLAFGSPICSHAIGCNPNVGSGPRTGEWWVWLGGSSDFEAAFVSQHVIIPPGEASLSFWLEMPVTPTSGTMRVMIDEVVLFQATGADAPAFPTYAEVEIDLSDFADGIERTLRIEAQLDAGSFFVDDVSLRAWVPILSLEPRTGTLAPGEAIGLTFTADATDVEPGTYHFEAVLSTNAPAVPETILPVVVYVQPVGTESPAGDIVLRLHPNHPNPFAQRTNIVFELARTGWARVEVLDVAGRRVATLLEGEHAQGRHELVWDGTGMAAGVYVLRLETESATRSRRVAIIR